MSADVLVGVVALLEQCAQQRAGVVMTVDDPLHTRRMLQAEAAGRELIAALVRPPHAHEWSLAGYLRRLASSVQTLVSASLTDDQPQPFITTRVQHIVTDEPTTRMVAHAAVVLLLASLDDDALAIDVRLARVPHGIWLTVESDRPPVESQPVRDVRRGIESCGGFWETEDAPHGGSWLVHVTVPCADLHEGEERHVSA